MAIVRSAPIRRLLIMHGGKDQREGMNVNIKDGGGEVRLLAKPKLPERLNCGCQAGNGGTPFFFMQWLAESEYEFGWYVEEDVVFTGHWENIFKLRVQATNAVMREDGTEMYLPENAEMGVKQDLVAHITRAAPFWKKLCRMPRKNSTHHSCFVNGVKYKTKWPVIGLSKKLAKGMMDSIATPGGVNGHQEPIMFPYCERFMNPPCRYTVIPDKMLGVFQLGHWGRFLKPKNHRTYTSIGLTNNKNLATNRLYHPIKCEADAGIGKLAKEMTRVKGRLDDIAEPGVIEAYFVEKYRQTLRNRIASRKMTGNGASVRSRELRGVRIPAGKESEIERMQVPSSSGGGGGGGGGEATGDDRSQGHDDTALHSDTGVEGDETATAAGTAEKEEKAGEAKEGQESESEGEGEGRDNKMMKVVEEEKKEDAVDEGDHKEEVEEEEEEEGKAAEESEERVGSEVKDEAGTTETEEREEEHAGEEEGWEKDKKKEEEKEEEEEESVTPAPANSASDV